MKINKEKEVKTEIHKKRTGKIHKKNETKSDNKTMTTRAKRSVTSAGRMAESAITENVEGGENIDGVFETTGIAIKPVKGAISEGNRIRKKISTSKLQKEVAGKKIRKKASNKGKELAKKSAKRTAKNASKNIAKKTSKKVTKETAKEVAKETAKEVASLLAPLVVPILIVVMVATGIVFAIIAVLYNSPFAIFLPPLESGDTIQTVTTQYVSEFNREIQTLVNEHKDADEGRKVYVDYEGMNSEPSNYYDIMCVYMVKYGYENMAIKMNETNKQNLKAVFDDICKYTTEKVTEKKGKKKKKYLEVRITLKSYTEMSEQYQFDEERKLTLNQLMSACITSNPSGSQTGGSQLSGLQESLTPQEITSISDKITNPIQKTVAAFVLSKVGYPYSQNLRNSGKAFDCSSLAYYAWKSAGVDIAFGGSTTAAAEAEGLKDKTVKEKDIQPGDLIFYSYTTNGRYKNISHVGIYVGNGKMVEAVDEAQGVCLGNYHNGGLVMICRPGK